MRKRARFASSGAIKIPSLWELIKYEKALGDPELKKVKIVNLLKDIDKKLRRKVGLTATKASLADGEPALKFTSEGNGPTALAIPGGLTVRLYEYDFEGEHGGSYQPSLSLPVRS